MLNRLLAASMLKSALICPVCLGKLAWSRELTTCIECAEKYPVEDGIPVMIPGVALGDRPQSLAGGSLPDYQIGKPRNTPRFHRWMLEEIMRRGARTVSASRTALTVCGGSGMDAEYLAKAGMSVIASDVSLSEARRALERSRRFDVHMAVVVADVTRLPFADASIDLVWTQDGLQTLTDVTAALNEMVRVAATAVSVNEPANFLARAVPPTGRRSRSRVGLAMEDIVEAVEKNGFEVAVAERYLVACGRRPGRPSKFLSTPGMFPIATFAWRGLCFVSPLGNRITVQARRREL